MGNPLDDIAIPELETTIDRVVERSLAMDFRWDWPCGVAFYGIGQAWRATGKIAYMEKLAAWVDEYLDLGLPPFMINAMAMGHCLIDLAEATGDEKYLRLIERKIDYLKKDARRFSGGILQHTVSASDDFPGQAWADTLFMAALFMLRAGVRYGDRTLVQDALFQFTSHEELLQDPKTDLYFHAWDDRTKSHLSGQRWARANAWAAYTMASALGQINYLYPEFMAIDGSLRDQLASLARLQTEAGLWRTILDDPSSYEETSASAGIGAAMVLYGHPLHARSAARAYSGLLANIDSKGGVRNVSAGTAVMVTAEDYRRVPRKRLQGWGQGLALAFLSALLSRAKALKRTET
ncbi:MAG: glycoside hydrolase family 88 protein [Spirochaetes bacterium]|nr:glycoside hydrolase family 88 protein [Spirochaetota bacterium]